MGRLFVEPTGQSAEIKVGESLLTVSKRAGLGIRYNCDGVPNCATCRVVVLSGGEHLSPVARPETLLIGNTYFLTKQRLGCQSILVSDGDVTIDISEHEEYRSSGRMRKVENKYLKEKEERERQRAEKLKNSLSQYKVSDSEDDEHDDAENHDEHDDDLGCDDTDGTQDDSEDISYKSSSSSYKKSSSSRQDSNSPKKSFSQRQDSNSPKKSFSDKQNSEPSRPISPSSEKDASSASAPSPARSYRKKSRRPEGPVS